MPSFNALACNERRSLDDSLILMRASFLKVASATAVCRLICCFSDLDFLNLPD